MTQLAPPGVPVAPDPGAWSARVLMAAGDVGGDGLAQTLAGQGFVVLLARPDLLVQQVDRGSIDLVLLRENGGSALAELAVLRQHSTVPVVLALRNGRRSLEGYLTAGADDCLARGVGADELAARLRAVLRRRARPVPGELLRAGPFTMDLARHVFATSGRALHLPPKEFGLLELLLRRDGRVVRREEALRTVWGATDSSDPTTVDVHVKRLRAKLEPEPARPRHLLTVRGLGYRFVG